VLAGQQALVKTGRPRETHRSRSRKFSSVAREGDEDQRYPRPMAIIDARARRGRSCRDVLPPPASQVAKASDDTGDVVVEPVYELRVHPTLVSSGGRLVKYETAARWSARPFAE
jgi:hypothetical protein